MSDATPGDAAAIREVVVLTDGKAITDDTRLHDLIVMRSKSEGIVKEEGDDNVGYKFGGERTGSTLDKKVATGIRLALETQHPILIFFIGIGEDVYLEAGRMLAEATGAEYVA